MKFEKSFSNISVLLFFEIRIYLKKRFVEVLSSHMLLLNLKHLVQLPFLQSNSRLLLVSYTIGGLLLLGQTLPYSPEEQSRSAIQEGHRLL